MVLAALGSHRSEGELRALLKTRPAGTSPGAVAIRLPEIGFDAAVVDGSESLLRQTLAADRPCIVHLWTAGLPHWDHAAVHAVVVTGMDDNAVSVNDPALGQPAQIPLAAFLAAWAAMDYLLLVIMQRE
jgi:ABC-type bacteriocin/lantibiotic exporter with double-glycine peptidase domain